MANRYGSKMLALHRSRARRDFGSIRNPAHCKEGSKPVDACHEGIGSRVVLRKLYKVLFPVPNDLLDEFPLCRAGASCDCSKCRTI